LILYIYIEEICPYTTENTQHNPLKINTHIHQTWIKNNNYINLFQIYEISAPFRPLFEIK
jgi:hypothetical protein